ncbi:MAG TPA: hypothetical protein VKB46_01825, partial [Pyrinomonadaceae bacterium]|nr:hypothetical protein [Pyrinomonadaceae bacterium]
MLHLSQFLSKLNLRSLTTNYRASRKLVLLTSLLLIAGGAIWCVRSVGAANVTWDGGGATNNWSEAANWSGDVVPGAGDIAVFDGTSTKDAVIDAGFAGAVDGLQINAGYTGTITQAITFSIGNSGFSQSSGTFTPGNVVLNCNGVFNQSGGTFNAPTGTLNFANNVTVTGGTFNPNSGTIAFVGGSTSNFLNVPATFTLNNVVVNKTSGQAVFYNSTSTVVVNGTLTLTDGTINSNSGTGTVDAHGAVVIDPGFDGGNATLVISGAATRTVTLPAGVVLPGLTVNGPNVTLDTSGAGSITFAQPVFVQSALTFTNGSVNFVFSNPFTFGAATFTPGSGDLTFNNLFTQNGGTFTPGSGALNFNNSFTQNGGTFNAPNSTLNFVNNVTVTGGTFNPNSGTIAFVGGSVSNFLNVPATFTLNNVVVNKTSGQAIFYNSTSTVVANGALTLTDGAINSNSGTGTIDAHGVVNFDPGFDGGSATLLISGAATRTVTLPAGVGLPGLTVNAPNVTLNTSGAGTITFAQALDVQSVLAFTNGSVNFVFSNPFTLGATTNFTPGSGDLTFNNAFTQNGGTFTPGSGALSFNNTFTQNGGTFNAPNSTLSFFNNVTVTGGIFNPNSGTIAFAGGSTSNFLNVPATFTLNNVVVNKTSGQAIFYNSTSTVVANGTLTLTDGAINSNSGTGTLDARGAVNIDPGFDGGNATLLISGAATRTVTLPAGVGLPGLTVNAPNVTLNTSGVGTITFAQPL